LNRENLFTMKICINCDAKNDETSNYCTSCGSKLIIDKVDSNANNISEKNFDIKIPIEVKSEAIQPSIKKQKKINHYLSNINTYIYTGVFVIIVLLFFLNSSSNEEDKKDINSSNNSYQNTLKEKDNVIDLNSKSDNCLQEKLYIKRKLDDILSNVKDIKDVYYRYRSDDNYWFKYCRTWNINAQRLRDEVDKIKFTCVSDFSFRASILYQVQIGLFYGSDSKKDIIYFEEVLKNSIKNCIKEIKYTHKDNIKKSHLKQPSELQLKYLDKLPKIKGCIGYWVDEEGWVDEKGSIPIIYRIRKISKSRIVIESMSFTHMQSPYIISKLKKIYKKGIVKYLQLEDDSDEYYVVEKNGDLSIYDRLGYISTYKKLK